MVALDGGHVGAEAVGHSVLVVVVADASWATLGEDALAFRLRILLAIAS